MAIRPWLWLAVPGLGALELVTHVVLAARAPEVEDYRALLPVIESLEREGDLLVIAPAWAEPLARQAWGNDRLPLSMIARADASTYAGAVEISSLGQRAAELSGFKETQAVQSGRFWLRRLENPSYEPILYSFAEHVAPGSLAVGEWNGEAERDCEFSARRSRSDSESISASDKALQPSSDSQLNALDLEERIFEPVRRFTCAGRKASFVGVTLVSGGVRPTRCIFAPAPLNGVLRLRFAGVPLGNVLSGSALRWQRGERSANDLHLAFSAYVGGQRIGREALRAGAGFKPFRFEFQAPAPRAEVVFEIEAERGASRDFCFSAEVR